MAVDVVVQRCPVTRHLFVGGIPVFKQTAAVSDETHILGNPGKVLGVKLQRRLPGQAFNGQVADILWVNATALEGLDKSDAVTQIIILDNIGIGSDQGAQVIARRLTPLEDNNPGHGCTSAVLAWQPGQLPERGG